MQNLTSQKKIIEMKNNTHSNKEITNPKQQQNNLKIEKNNNLHIEKIRSIEIC